MAGIINSRRRWFGLFFLLLSVGLLVWGQTWLSDALKGWGYIAYWTMCLLVTQVALVLALLDARATRREIRSQQLRILKETFGAEEDASAGKERVRGERGEHPVRGVRHSDE
ncbi:MAG: hypothetical protein RI897_2038 [Verrucomicrobiota bacterium]|jgi:hypothetical protein